MVEHMVEPQTAPPSAPGAEPFVEPSDVELVEPCVVWKAAEA